MHPLDTGAPLPVQAARARGRLGRLSGMRQEEVPAAMSPLVVMQVPIRRDGQGSEALAPVEGQAECLKAASVAGAWREVHLE